MTAFAAAYSAASGQTISPKPRSLQLPAREVRRAAALDHVRDQRRGELRGDLGELLPGLRRLDEQRVGARLLVGEAALDRGVEAERLARVGAGDDEQVALAARVGGGADLGRVLLRGDDLLALEVTALLRPHLVLEEHARRARVLEVADGAQHVHGAAVAGVGVDDHRCGGDARDVAGRVGHLGLGQEAEVRLAEMGGGHRVAGDEDDVEADAGGDARRERVVDAGHQDGVLRDEVADLLGGGPHG